MKIKKSFMGILPKIDPSVFIAQNTSLVGDLKILKNSSVWYGCTIRADVNFIAIGAYTNIQDGTVVHVGSKPCGQTQIGDHVTIGHQCIIHACTLQDFTFVGMGSVIMDGAVLEINSMLGAGSLLTEGKVIKSGQLWLGRPAKYIRDLSNTEILAIKQSAQNYYELSRKYLDTAITRF
jgi:carbonic anhydrase/acetyltransferase-like protein (isoleucine patch superfamily)